MQHWPADRSLMVMDNMPTHRAIEGAIRAAVAPTGGHLIWGPPRSPDLNPIEKFWDVVLAGMNRRCHQAASGVLGPARRLNDADLHWVLQNARMTRHALEECGFTHLH